MIRHVLVGTDGSKTADAAVDRAVEVAGGAGARLTILSVGPEGERIAADAAERHQGAGVEIDAVGAAGEPASTLVQTAEHGDYDLLVTGNKAMTGLRRLAPVGRVPAKVAHHLPCSLLVVKTT